MAVRQVGKYYKSISYLIIWNNINLTLASAELGTACLNKTIESLSWAWHSSAPPYFFVDYFVLPPHIHTHDYVYEILQNWIKIWAIWQKLLSKPNLTPTQPKVNHNYNWIWYEYDFTFCYQLRKSTPSSWEITRQCKLNQS